MRDKSARDSRKEFTIVIDTREQKPYTFAAIPADQHEQKSRPDRLGYDLCTGAPILLVSTTTAKLDQGDYSILGYEQQVGIERKSKADLYSTIASGRERFEREFERLADLHASHFDPVKPFAAVVVEADFGDIIGSPPIHTRLRPKTIVRTVIAWQQRYPQIHWWFVPGRSVAEVITYRILDRWYRDNVVRSPTEVDSEGDEKEMQIEE